MPKKLPKKIYLKWNTEGDEPFLEPAEEVRDLADLGSTTTVGMYELKKRLRIKSEFKLTEFTAPK